MTIEEAIEHCREVAAKDCTECGKEHLQLACWLTELKQRREREEAAKKPKTYGDCIRNMTDDEELLIEIGVGCYRCAYINGECDRGYGKRCIDGNLEWFKREWSEDA